MIPFFGIAFKVSSSSNVGEKYLMDPHMFVSLSRF